MKPKSELEVLLEDVLHETGRFRNESLQTMLAEVRRARTIRRWRQGILASAGCVGVALVLLSLGPAQKPGVQPPAIVKVPAPPAVALIRSDPNSVQIVESSPDSVAVLETRDADLSVNRITDAELLGFLTGRSAVLVRHSAAEAEVMFLDPTARDPSPVN